MHSAIIYVVMPSNPHEARRASATFLAAIERLDKLPKPAVRLLGEFVWVIDFQKAPDALAIIVSACENLGLPYGILPLADAPQWIERHPNVKREESNS